MSKIEEKRPHHTVWSEWKRHLCPYNEHRSISSADTKEFKLCKCYDEKPETSFVPIPPETTDIEILSKFDAIHGTDEVSKLAGSQMQTVSGEAETKITLVDFKDEGAPARLGNEVEKLHLLPIMTSEDQDFTLDQAVHELRRMNPQSGVILFDGGKQRIMFGGEMTNADLLWTLESAKNRLMFERREEDE